MTELEKIMERLRKSPRWKDGEQKCQCRDGVIFTRDGKGCERAYRCSCPLGEKHKLPVYQRKEFKSGGRDLQVKEQE